MTTYDNRSTFINMGKETEPEVLKKRRKTVTSTAGNTIKDGDMYKTIINYEEKEAMDRSPENDSMDFLSCCESVRRGMSEIAKLKASDSPTAKEEIREIQIQTSLVFLELKKLNRMEKFRTKFSRDSLTAAKSAVDSKHLQLQNLLYEVMHLKKEVIKCLQFKSKDESIELVPQEEFFREAPESISQSEITKNDPHQLKLARLEWELTQRKQLAALCDELSESKKGVAANIETKQARLDNLGPQLRTILEASKPLQDSFGLPLDKIHQEHKKAELLVSPLYVLYAKTSAYRDAYDPLLSVSVEGDEDEAKRVNNQEGSQDSDSDQETQSENIIEEVPVHKKRHHRLSREARQEEKRMRLLQKHPLSVQIIINLSNETKLTLKFFYMSYLKVITVESKLDTGDCGAVTAGDMLISESVLRELYPKDLGIDSPNPANNYQLMRHNLSSFDSLGVGIPYKWAQRMAGLHFISLDVNEQKRSNDTLAQDSTESVLREIKRRVKARLDLCNEIRLLEEGSFLPSNNSNEPMPDKVFTEVSRFSTITWKSYSNNPDTLGFCKQGLVTPVNIFYEAVLRRGNNELVARIAIKPDYPKATPVFSISLNPSIPSTMDVVRDIEREVNVMWKKPPTLSLQLQRLRSCFDIYLETEKVVASREQIFFHPFKGRTRARPYKYLTLGGGVFTQR